jgi:hypothetical protein
MAGPGRGSSPLLQLAPGINPKSASGGPERWTGHIRGASGGRTIRPVVRCANWFSGVQLRQGKVAAASPLIERTVWFTRSVAGMSLAP